ncbi:MAG TPA: efflux RND transporter permease subunit, partial [Candidatus Polarisedimenticolia bacterium]
MSREDFYPRLVRHRTLVFTITLALMCAGLLALGRLGSGIYPEVEFPRIVVVARSGDVPPEQMQASVVRPLEESLATVIGVRRIRTRIIRGAAEIALQFSEGTDMWRSLQLTDAAIGRARGQLPPETEIESEKVTPADFPILSFNLVGGTPTSRREAAEFIVRPAFSRAPGVGRVEVVGGDPREVEVV